MMVNDFILLFWLVVDLPLWKIWVHQLGSLFPTEWKVIKFMFQTTNQVLLLLLLLLLLRFSFDKLLIVDQSTGKMWCSIPHLRFPISDGCLPFFYLKKAIIHPENPRNTLPSIQMRTFDSASCQCHIIEDVAFPSRPQLVQCRFRPLESVFWSMAASTWKTGAGEGTASTFGRRSRAWPTERDSWSFWRAIWPLWSQEFLGVSWILSQYNAPQHCQNILTAIDLNLTDPVIDVPLLKTLAARPSPFFTCLDV